MKQLAKQMFFIMLAFAAYAGEVPESRTEKIANISDDITSVIVGKWEIAPNKRSSTGTLVFDDRGHFQMREVLADGAGVGTTGDYILYSEYTPARIDICPGKCGLPGSEWTTRFGIVRILSGEQIEIHTSADTNYPGGFSDDSSDSYTMVLSKVKP